MTNLAQEQHSYQAEVVRFPKQERQAMSDKDEGYTPMPNFICDEGYLAVLDGNAIKCLWLLNRHVKGFHLKAKGMSEALVMKITGIKDGRTVQKYMGELAKVQLIKIEKERGKSNVYSLTFNDRLPTQNVGASKAKAQNVPTPDVGTPPTQHVGGSTYMACGSVKEIDLKENIKRKEEEERTNFQAQNRTLNFIEYHTQDRIPTSFKNLCQKYSVEQDFFAQAKVSFPNHSEQQIQKVLSDLAQWSLSASNFMPQKWMSIWLDFMKREPTAKEQQAAQNKKSFSEKQTSSRDVNHKWGEVQEYAPATGEVDLEGLI